MAFRIAASRLAKRVTVVTSVFAAGTCYVYRPRGSWEEEYFKKLKGRQPVMSAPEQFLYNIGQSIAVLATMSVFKAMMYGFNTVEMDGIDKLREHIDPDSRKGQGLITVSNHSSILDDPGLMSCILPYHVVWRPSTMRWSVCSEELCFFNPFVGAFMGAGRVLPVKRGGSVFQKCLVGFQEAVDRGEWAHIFPEGRCWQEGGSPLRDETGRWCSDTGRCGTSFSKLGPIKWGIAKVIANSEKPPLVVPFYHLGMEDIMPQDEKNDIRRSVPYAGAKVTMKVGQPIDFADLLKAYFDGAAKRAAERAKARVLRGVEEVKAQAGPVLELCTPPSRFVLRCVPPDHSLLTEEEAAAEDQVRWRLYSAIATRIGEALGTLEDQVRQVRREKGYESLDDKQW